MSKVFIALAKTVEERKQAISEGLKWIDWEKLIPIDSRVFLKPNLTTYPIYTPGVTTSPEFIEALLQILNLRTQNIFIGESDGGRHAWSADDAFRGHGLYEIAAKYGARLVNLSHEPWVSVDTTIGGRKVIVELPSLLLNNLDVFITLPVPKFHAMTYVSMAFKNQWGCLPDAMRFRHHPDFDRKIVAVAKLLPTKIAIFDGKYFLDNNGPLLGGIHVEKNLVIVSDDFGAGSLACCEVMGISWEKARHHRVAHREGMFPASMAEVICNQDLAEFKDHPFRLRRTFWNYLALLSFRNRFITWLVYDSPLDKPLHWFLYLFRRNPVTAFQTKKETLIAQKTSFFDTTRDE